MRLIFINLQYVYLNNLLVLEQKEVIDSIRKLIENGFYLNIINSNGATEPSIKNVNEFDEFCINIKNNKL